MTKEQQAVKDWMSQAKQATPSAPHIFIGDKTKHERLELLGECYKQLVVASLNNDIILIAFCLSNLNHTLLGTANAYGIDLEPINEALHKAIIDNTKPDIESLIKQQYKEGFNNDTK